MHAGRPADTSPEAWDRQFDLYRRMTFVQRADRIRALTLAANRIAFAGLRHRYPAASEPELRLRLVALRLGEPAVSRAYGWSPGPVGA